MDVKNLHSLINGRYFIHEAYGASLLPVLIMLREGKLAAPDQDAKKDPGFTTMARNGAARGAKPGAGQNDYVLVMDLKDPIYKYSQECGPQGTKSKMATLEMYRNDPACVGVVLDIDSGGGQVSGTPEFYDYLLGYGKPVVAYTDGYMCSAAYYIGSAASYIVANKRADHIGSIGVMISFIDWTGYYEGQGAKVITEYATKSTEKNKNFEDLLKGKPEGYIKNELDPLAEEFHTDMKAVRASINEEALKGGTWNAAGALKMGLVDEIGTLQTAVQKVFDLAAEQQQNQNLNTEMSTPRANLQAVLGLTEPLAETPEKGSYIQATQLDAIETKLGANATALEAATNAQTTAETALANATAAHTADTNATNAAVDAMVAAAGFMPTGTTATEKIAELSAHYAPFNSADGGKTTTVAVDPNPTGTASDSSAVTGVEADLLARS